MTRRAVAALWLAVASLSAAGFDPAKDVALSVARGNLQIALPPGVHLACRRFKVALIQGAGRLSVGPLPAPSGKDAAGDPVWRGSVRVPLQLVGASGPVVLRVTFQPCTEGPDSVCFLPRHRDLAVDPAASGLR